MPYKHKDLLIPREKDRRVKLTDEQKEEIRRLYPIVKSQRKLAAQFGVSRRLITFVLQPEKLKQNYQARLDRGGSKIYYERKSWVKTMKEHRHYKQGLYLKHELIKKGEK